MNAGNWLIIILYLLLPLGQFQRLPLGIAGASIYVHDLVLMAIWAWVLWQRIRHPEVEVSTEGSENDGEVKIFWIFTAIALLSWLINLPRWGQESIIGFGYLIRWVLLSAPLFLLLITDYRLPITELIKKSIFLLAVLGWLQYFIFPDLTRMKYFGWDDHYFRLIGTLLDPNFMGILIVIGLSLEFSAFSFKPLAFGRKLFYLITLAFTYSRASYLSWLVFLFGWGINRVFRKPIKGGILKLGRIFFRSLTAYSVYFWLAVSAIIFVLMPRPAGEGGDFSRTASISGRLQSYRQVWEIIKDNPVFGVGFNNYRLTQNKGITDHAAAGADNSFLFVWATTGVFGLIAFLWLIFSLQPWWLVLPIVIHSFFNNTLFFPWVLIYLWGIQVADEN